MGPRLLLQDGDQRTWHRHRDCVRLGTEGPTIHLQGAPSWHSENIITSGAGTSKTTGAPLGLELWEAPGGDSNTERQS